LRLWRIRILQLCKIKKKEKGKEIRKKKIEELVKRGARRDRK
jgi:hypothetical protein